MGLEGRLDDLAVLDMLQIIAFSKKSGYLRIEGPMGRGAVVVLKGRVVFAYCANTLDRVREIARAGPALDEAQRELLRQQVEVSLRDLARLNKGRFDFQVNENFDTELEGMRLSNLFLDPGLEAKNFLLDLTVEMDQQRRETGQELEKAFPPEQAEPERTAAATPASLEVSNTEPAAPREPPDYFTVILVDDEALVTEVVGQELERLGFVVLTAANPLQGLKLARERKAAGDNLLVATDLKMPTSSGNSFSGGFELARRLSEGEVEVPVLLMADRLSDQARERARELGIRRVVFKPTLSQLDPEQYEADLRSFAAMVQYELQQMTIDADDPLEFPGEADGEEAEENLMDYLANVTKKLAGRNGSTEISELILEVAGKYLDRGVLFIVKTAEIRGLAGFGIGSEVPVAQLAIPLEQIPVVQRVIETTSSCRLDSGLEAMEGSLYRTIGRKQATECIFLPVLYGRAVLLLLYGDNETARNPIRDVGGLELFLTQAGIALENKLLQQKLTEANRESQGGGVVV